MFIAGIDGGGTHTRLEIRERNNQFLRREEFGPFNLNSIGEAAFRSLLRRIFAACGDMAACAGLCIGAAGVSNPAAAEIMAEELRQAGFAGKWKLCGDQEIALRGAMDGPGVVVIAGTGSICFGRNESGITARSGGFGHLIDDGGSGYALGRDVLNCAVRTIDGRCGSREILEAVLARLKDAAQIVSFVYSPSTGKAAIAEYAAIALEQAERGSREAREILARGAEELLALVKAVQNRLELQRCPIALLGGLLSTDNPYRRIVAETLSPLGTVIAPGHDALWGAAQTAWELQNHDSGSSEAWGKRPAAPPQPNCAEVPS